jgi:hypothetical protein
MIFSAMHKVRENKELTWLGSRADKEARLRSFAERAHIDSTKS